MFGWRNENETQQERQASACPVNSCGYLRSYLVDGHGILVDRGRDMYRHNDRVLGGFAMNCTECEGDGCTKCTVFCGDCLTPLENCGCRP